MGIKLNRIVQDITYDDLFIYDKISEYPKLLLQFPNPNTDLDTEEIPNDNTDTDLSEDRTEFYKKLYQNSWNDLKYKNLFNNDYNFFCFWLDIVSDEYFDTFISGLTSNTSDEKDILNNSNYIAILDQYNKAGKSIDKMIQNAESATQQGYQDNLTLLQVFSAIDNQISTMNTLIISSRHLVVLVAKTTEKIIEMKKSLMVPSEFIMRDLVYTSQPDRIRVYIAILEFID